MQAVYDLPNVAQGIGDACMYGKRIPAEFGFGAGLYLYKQHRWLANHAVLLHATCRRCNGNHEHYTSARGEHVHGKLTKWSGEYTAQLARAILSATRQLSVQATSTSA